MPVTLTPHDLYRADVLTGQINLRVQPEAVYDLGSFAPITPVNNRRVKVRVRAGTLARLGQFRGLNALTPLSAGSYESQEMEIELVTLAEKERLVESQYINLRSVDEGVAAEAAAEIVNIGVRLRRQNLNLKRWMVAKALTDTLTITYPDGVAVDIDFDLDNTDAGMSASHVIAPPATIWSNVAADIIGNIKAWKKIIRDDSGATPTRAVVSETILEYMQANTAIQQRNGTTAEPKEPTTAQRVAELVGLEELVTYDSLYKSAAGTTTRFTLEDRFHLMTPTVDGVPTVQLLDGPVVSYNGETNDLSVAANPGMVADLWTTPDPPSRHVRVTTSNIPMVIREGFLVAEVY